MLAAMPACRIAKILPEVRICSEFADRVA